MGRRIHMFKRNSAAPLIILTRACLDSLSTQSGGAPPSIDSLSRPSRSPKRIFFSIPSRPPQSRRMSQRSPYTSPSASTKLPAVEPRVGDTSTHRRVIATPHSRPRDPQAPKPPAARPSLPLQKSTAPLPVPPRHPSPPN